MIGLDQRLQPNAAEVAAKVMDGEAIIINLSNGMYYSMDRAGGYIWELIASRHSQSEIAAAVSAAYGIEPPRAAADVAQLVTELIGERLVLPATDSGPSVEIAAPEQPDVLPYEAPRLNKYQDMGDLLALDPPMPELEDLDWEAHGERRNS